MTDAKTLAPTGQSPGELAHAIERAYGLLWLVPVDRRTPAGLAISLARGVLLTQIDRDGQARGITAARELMTELPQETKP